MGETVRYFYGEGPTPFALVLEQHMGQLRVPDPGRDRVRAAGRRGHAPAGAPLLDAAELGRGGQLLVPAARARGAGRQPGSFTSNKNDSPRADVFRRGPSPVTVVVTLLRAVHL